jgi:hypothetical protein
VERQLQTFMLKIIGRVEDKVGEEAAADVDAQEAGNENDEEGRGGLADDEDPLLENSKKVDSDDRKGNTAFFRQ